MRKYYNNIDEDLEFYLSKNIIPVKYAYILTAANYHSAYANSQNYKSIVGIYKEEYNVLLKHIQKSDYDYCEIGADDGSISCDIINFLKANGLIFNCHFFLDFSVELLEKCELTTKKLLKNLKCAFVQCDVENDVLNLPFNCSSKKVVFFLGNTLGNVENELEVLQKIFDFMNNDDFLVIGLTLCNNSVDELKPYSNEVFRESVLEFLRIIGIQPYPKNYSLRYDERKKEVICEYQLERPFNYKNVYFKKGDKIRCFKSKRYSLNYCQNIFEKKNFNIIETVIDETKRHVIFLLTKSHN